MKYCHFSYEPILCVTLQMFCLQNTQMFVCVLNSRTNIGCFYMYLSVMDNKYFHVVFTLNQTLNSLKNKHILSNLQKKILFSQIFSLLTKLSQFFCLIWDLILISTDICLWLLELSKVSKNRYVCLEINDKYLSLFVILLFTFAV